MKSILTVKLFLAILFVSSVNLAYAISRYDYIDKTQNIILEGTKSNTSLITLRLKFMKNEINTSDFKQQCTSVMGNFIDYQISWVSVSTSFVDEVSKYTSATVPGWLKLGLTIDPLMKVFLEENYAYAMATCRASMGAELYNTIEDNVHKSLASLALVQLYYYRDRLFD